MLGIAKHVISKGAWRSQHPCGWGAIFAAPKTHFTTTSTTSPIRGTLNLEVLRERHGVFRQGDYAEWTVTWDSSSVAKFAELTGDVNPVHLDEQYARDRSRFGKPIVHGMLYGSMFGTIFGSQFEGALYLNQSFRFRKPVFVGDTVTAVITVDSVRETPHILQCETTIHRHIQKNDGGEKMVVMTGNASVLIPPQFDDTREGRE